MPVYINDLGYADGRSRRLEDQLYFLDESGKILATRAACSTPRIGENFFHYYPMSEDSKAEFLRYLHGFGNRFAFFRVGEQTAIFLTSFYSSTDCVAVLLPEEPIASHAKYPGALAQSLAYTYLSAELENRKIPPTTEQYQALRALLAVYEIPLYHRDESSLSECWALINTLAIRAGQISYAVGCRLDYDFSELRMRSVKNPALDRVSGLCFLLFAAARRSARDRALKLEADCIRCAVPMLAATWELWDPNDPLPELEILPAIATWYDFPLEIQRNQRDITVFFSLCEPEYSRQGVKAKYAYPLPSVRNNISLPLPDQSGSFTPPKSDTVSSQETTSFTERPNPSTCVEQ